jgi:hypothetical protein
MLDKTFAFLESEESYVQNMPEGDKHKRLFKDAHAEVTSLRALPDIILLAGSARFKQAFEEVAEKLALEGAIVLGKHVFKPGTSWELPEHEKDMLHAIQFRKVDLASEVYVVNVDGYVGHDTYNVIRYAVRHDKPLRFYREHVLPLDPRHKDQPMTIHAFLGVVKRRIELEEGAG